MVVLPLGHSGAYRLGCLYLFELAGKHLFNFVFDGLHGYFGLLGQIGLLTELRSILLLHRVRLLESLLLCEGVFRDETAARCLRRDVHV